MPPPPGPEPEPPPPPTPPLPVSRASSSSALAAEEAFCFLPRKFPGARRPERLQGRCGAAFSALWEEGRAWELPFSVFPFWVPFFSVPSGDRGLGASFFGSVSPFFLSGSGFFCGFGSSGSEGMGTAAGVRSGSSTGAGRSGWASGTGGISGRAGSSGAASGWASGRSAPRSGCGSGVFSGRAPSTERAVPLLRARP